MVLKQFEKDYCLNINVATSVVKQELLFDSLKMIGIILIIRDVSLYNKNYIEYFYL